MTTVLQTLIKIIIFTQIKTFALYLAVKKPTSP